MLSGLRVSLRIARREALRHKGRSLLSITLLALPILGVSLGATVYDTTDLSDVERARQYLGQNDAYVEYSYSNGPIEQSTWLDDWPMVEETGSSADEPADPEEVLAALPEGSQIAPYTIHGSSGAVQVSTPDGLGAVETHDYDLTDPIYEQANLEFVEGAAPEQDQVALSTAAAKYLDLGVGDQVEVFEGETAVEYEVGAVVELPWALNSRYIVGTDFDSGEPTGFLVDAPDGFDYDDALAVNELGLSVWATSLVENPPPSDQSAMYSIESDEAGYLLAGLLVTVLIIEVVLLSGPAFAISVRTRQREFAIMSASGASAAHIRNTVLAGGFLFGVIAAAVAVTVGILSAWALLPLIESVFGYRSAGLKVMPALQVAVVAFAILTGLLTALTAALSASKINVTAALAGRVPKRTVRKRWAVLGVLLIVGGAACGFVGVNSWNMVLMAGSIVVLQLGIVACTPTIVAWISKLGRWMPPAPRMALRDAGRNRGSTAPAISAVMGVVAASIAFSMAMAAEAQRTQDSQVITLAQDTLTLDLVAFGADDPPGAEDFDTILAETERSLERHLDDVETVPIDQYSLDCGESEDTWCELQLVRPEANRCPYWSADTTTEAAREQAVAETRDDPRCNETLERSESLPGETPVTSDPAVVAAYTELEGADLDEAVAHLEAGGILVSDEFAVEDGDAVVRYVVNSWEDEEGAVEDADDDHSFPAMTVDEDRLGEDRFLLGPGAAEELGLSPSEEIRQYMVQTSTAVTSAEIEAIDQELFAQGSVPGIERYVSSYDYTDDFTQLMLLVVAGLSGVIALGATAVSTGLIISESRRDMTTLGAVGATPGLRKRLAMWQTLVIAWLGAVLGTAAGCFGYMLIRAALNSEYEHQYPTQTLYGWELPWSNFAIALLAVPLVAVLGAALFTRSQLPSERRLT